ncbi:MAG: hypothetical protein V3W34_10985 [Phycisphaerae bacterium]
MGNENIAAHANVPSRSSLAHGFESVGFGRMNAWERQQVFREMVGYQLRQGRLSRGRRRRIVQYAACLGINAIQAGRLVQEAHRLHEQRSTAVAPVLRYDSGQVEEGRGEGRDEGTKGRRDGGEGRDEESPQSSIVPDVLRDQSSKWKAALAIVLGGTLVNSWLITRLFS